MRQKIGNRLFIAVFIVILLIPSIFINTEKNQISLIDNRRLTEFEGFTWRLDHLVHNLESYYNDRLGFRTELITFNQIYNYKIFNVLVNPNDSLGKNGHMFFSFERQWEAEHDLDTEFLDSYTDYIKEMQTYCEKRSVTFLFAFNPLKPLIYPEYLPDGLNMEYQYKLRDGLFERLNTKNVHYIDLAIPLLEAKQAGLPVMNVKFDAGHWNGHGAFYGMSSIMQELSKVWSSLSPLYTNDFELTYETKKYLPVSGFPINEAIPHYTPKVSTTTQIKIYDREIKKGSYPYSSHFVNTSNSSAPRGLIFHGSHMSVEVQRYIANQFSEVFFIWSYHVIEYFPYYFNIVNPDIVLYEVADRTINNGFINVNLLKNKVLQPPLTQFAGLDETKLWDISEIHNTSIIDENRLKELKFQITGNNNLKYAYMQLKDRILDFDIIENTEEGATISVVIDKLLFDINQVIITLVSKPVDGTTFKQTSYISTGKEVNQ